MDTYCGILSVDKSSNLRFLLEKQSNLLSRSLKMTGQHTLDNDWCGYTQFISKDERLITKECKLDKISVIGRIEIKNKDELLNLFSVDEKYDEKSFVKECYEKYELEFLKYLDGVFGFVIVDTIKQEIVCITDNVSNIPFYIASEDLYYCWSNSIRGILFEEKFIQVTKSEFERLVLGIDFHDFESENEASFIKLPPASYCKITKDGYFVENYYKLGDQQFDFDNMSDIEILNGLKDKLFEAVKFRSIGCGAIGAELSGGLDSSFVLSVLVKLGIDVSVFTNLKESVDYTYKEQRIDEYYWSKLVKEYLQITSEYYVDKLDSSIYDAMKQNILHVRKPIFHSYGTFLHKELNLASEKKVGKIFSGFGGDQLISSPCSGYLDILIANKEWHLLFNYYSAKFSVIRAAWKILKKWVKRLFTSEIGVISEKRYNYFANLFELTPVVQEEYNKEYLRTKALEISTLKKHISLCESQIDEFNSNNSVELRLAHTYEYGLMYNIEFVYPLLDKTVMEYYLSMPDHLKVNALFGRYALRKISKGLLPEEIVWRRDKSGSVMPFVLSQLVREKMEIEKYLLENREKFNTIIDVDKAIEWFQKIVKSIEEGKAEYFPGRFIGLLSYLIYMDLKEGAKKTSQQH
ncbi:MAG: hypothetical protein C0594_13360 [Marinilabiliales bacterium]|nr:MAG: hypothetical protein C0594_13360 [Marinilabiliales bacterium]